jgi:hypothetical protein
VLLFEAHHHGSCKHHPQDQQHDEQVPASSLLRQKQAPEISAEATIGTSSLGDVGEAVSMAITDVIFPTIAEQSVKVDRKTSLGLHAAVACQEEATT